MKVHNMALFLLGTLLVYFISPLHIEAATNALNTVEKMDVVMAVDVSNSMKDSDKKKISNEAMKMFIDMLSKDGDKVGLVAYTDQIIREKALLNIQSDEDKKEIKNYIDSLSLDAYTDLAVGVTEAVKILDTGKEKGHMPLIILLTDGNNYLNPKSGSTEDQSDRNLKKAVDKAKDEGYPIYTIGLNANGTLNKAPLENISNETNGKFFTTNSAEDLPRILSEIFANHLKLKVVPITSLVGNGNYQEVTITIPNSNVTEANISITSGKTIEAKLFSPDGKEVEIPSNQVYYSKSKSYSLIKLIKPVEGDWKIQVKGVAKDKVDVNMVFNYDLGLQLEEPAQKAYKKGDKVEIRAFLETNGQKLQSQDMYKGMISKLLVTDLATQKTKEYPLENDGESFHGEYILPDNHEYELKVEAEDKSFYRETNVVKIGGVLATATNKLAKVQKAKETNWSLYSLIGLGLIGLVVLVFVIYVAFKKANKGFVGQIIVEIRDENTGERTTPQYRKLNVFKGKIKLHQLLQLAPEFVETESVILIPGKNDTLLLFNKGEVVIERSGRAIDSSKEITIKKNDKLRVNLSKVNKSISIEYII